VRKNACLHGKRVFLNDSNEIQPSIFVNNACKTHGKSQKRLAIHPKTRTARTNERVEKAFFVVLPSIFQHYFKKCLAPTARYIYAVSE
tara:strand:+ start:206 stop:469 length:264 start_codon:yes stop_codon:yes gene_type:complete